MDADRQRDETIIAAMREYDGPLNRKGRPRMRPLRQTPRGLRRGLRFAGAERNALWAKMAAE